MHFSALVEPSCVLYLPDTHAMPAATFEVVEYTNFDTCGSSSDVAAMVTYLEALASTYAASCPSCYVLVGVDDEAEYYMTSDAYAALQSSLGATLTSSEFCYRCSYALISRLGDGTGGGATLLGELDKFEMRNAIWNVFDG